EQAQVELVPEHGRDGTLLGEPREGMRNECEYVELQGTAAPQGSWKPCATTIRPRSRSTSRTQASTSGSAAPESSSSTSFATPGTTSATRPSRRPPSSSTSRPTSWKA